MRQLIYMFSLNFAICLSTLHAVESYPQKIENQSAANGLFVVKMDLSETLLENIRSLKEEIKHTWPDSKYYRETIDFGKVFPALQEGLLIERTIPDR